MSITAKLSCICELRCNWTGASSEPFGRQGGQFLTNFEEA